MRGPLVKLVTCADLHRDDGTVVRANALEACFRGWYPVNLVAGTTRGWQLEAKGRLEGPRFLKRHVDRFKKYAKIYALLLKKSHHKGDVLYYLCNDFVDAPACLLL